jgi:hypothetical protein
MDLMVNHMPAAVSPPFGKGATPFTQPSENLNTLIERLTDKRNEADRWAEMDEATRGMSREAAVEELKVIKERLKELNSQDKHLKKEHRVVSSNPKIQTKPVETSPPLPDNWFNDWLKDLLGNKNSSIEQNPVMNNKHVKPNHSLPEAIQSAEDLIKGADNFARKHPAKLDAVMEVDGFSESFAEETQWLTDAVKEKYPNGATLKQTYQDFYPLEHLVYALTSVKRHIHAMKQKQLPFMPEPKSLPDYPLANKPDDMPGMGLASALMPPWFFGQQEEMINSIVAWKNGLPWLKSKANFLEALIKDKLSAVKPAEPVKNAHAADLNPRQHDQSAKP